MDTNQKSKPRHWLQLDHVYKNNIPASPSAKPSRRMRHPSEMSWLEKRNETIDESNRKLRAIRGVTLQLDYLHPTKGWRTVIPQGRNKAKGKQAKGPKPEIKMTNYWPHQGEQEMARRHNQILAGQLLPGVVPSGRGLW